MLELFKENRLTVFNFLAFRVLSQLIIAKDCQGLHVYTSWGWLRVSFVPTILQVKDMFFETKLWKVCCLKKNDGLKM
jgi:hypothetical protein